MSIDYFVLRYNISEVFQMIFKRIKALRVDNDFTQTFVGDKINIPQRTYSYYESGKRVIPPQVLISLAKLYDTSVDYLLELTDDPKP